MTDSFPLELYTKGYTDLISVIPPGAPLAPGSRMQSSSLGKAPGVKTDAGWRGYNWREYRATSDDIARWEKEAANFGLRADWFPGLDIDVTDEEAAEWIERLALTDLGWAPVRFGRAPKRLLMYHLMEGSEYLTRMRLWIERPGESHMIEMLGKGQQYLVCGTHPVTMKPYQWNVAPMPSPELLTHVDVNDVRVFFDGLKVEAERRGWVVHREGDGRERTKAKVDQSSLVAPSVEKLQELVDGLPNDDKSYPGRDSYIRVGYAIRAAAGDEVEEGYEVFASWAARHPHDERVSGNPATWRADYDRMHPPFVLGWPWLQDEARRFGRSNAAEDFEPLFPTSPPAESQPAALPDRLPNGDSTGQFYEEFVEHPEWTDTPTPCVPHFAWAGHKTLFAGREKAGKSTLLLAGIIAATRGEDFLGEGTERQLVVWLTESARPTLYHAMKMGAPAPRSLLVIPMGKEPPSQLAAAVKKHHPTVVVVDTLFRYAGIEDENNASQWQPFLKQFDAVAETGAALVVVHHSTKGSDDGRYRGSSAIGAWADFIMEMALPNQESDVRNISCKGKYDIDNFAVRYDRETFRFTLLTNGQKEAAKEQKATDAVVKWLTGGGSRPPKESFNAAVKAGLAVKEGKGRGKWRLTTADERAQQDMQ